MNEHSICIRKHRIKFVLYFQKGQGKLKIQNALSPSIMDTGKIYA